MQKFNLTAVHLRPFFGSQENQFGLLACPKLVTGKLLKGERARQGMGSAKRFCLLTVRSVRFKMNTLISASPDKLTSLPQDLKLAFGPRKFLLGLRTDGVHKGNERDSFENRRMS